MSTYIVTVFPDETKAYQGVHALDQLHAEGSISLYDQIVVQRQPDGRITTKDREPAAAIATGVGALLGALVGLFGGPVGVAIGIAAGGSLGLGTAAVHAEVSDEFLEDIARQMKPGDYAVLAEVSEGWTAPVDTRMRELGATVMREERSDVVDDVIAKRAVAHKAAHEQWKSERAGRKAERTEAKLENSFGGARERLLRVADKAHKRLDDTKREMQQKLDALDEHAKKATPEVRTRIEQRFSEIRKEFGERERKLSLALETAQQALQA
jgi:uncharacterized membrane protein